MESIVILYYFFLLGHIPLAWSIGSLIYFAYKKMFTFKHLGIALGPSVVYAIGLLIYIIIAVFGVL